MLTPFHLHNKKILVTGASSGIGRAVSVALSKMGASLVITGRDNERLVQVFSDLTGNNHEVVLADLSVDDEIDFLVSKISKLDGVVHSMGYFQTIPVQFLDEKKIRETMKVNFESPVLLMGKLIRGKCLNKKASIVFISSISSEHPYRGGALYSASKSGIESLSKTLALELSVRGIRSNCILPGMVKTEMYEKAEKDASSEVLKLHLDKYPLGVGLPIDVANAVIYLLSDASRWVTGTNLTLDGGFLLGG